MQSVAMAGGIGQHVGWTTTSEGLQHLSVSTVRGAIEVVWHSVSLPGEWMIGPDKEVAAVLEMEVGAL